MEKIYINADGGSRGNPGNAAIGIIIFNKHGKILETYKKQIGITTNNIAEYKSLIKALQLAEKYAKKQKRAKREVIISMDSELVIRQIKGLYKVKSKNLRPLFDKLKTLESPLKNMVKLSYRHVSRNNKYQKKADQLVNRALYRKS